MIQETIDNFPNFGTPSDIRSRNKIFINGSWIYIIDNPEDIMEGLLRKRRNDIISREISSKN